MTILHKAGALATVDEADDYARKSGATNTVVVDGEKLIGFTQTALAFCGPFAKNSTRTSGICA